jgi:hypothetical protein
LHYEGVPKGKTLEAIMVLETDDIISQDIHPKDSRNTKHCKHPYTWILSESFFQKLQ